MLLLLLFVGFALGVSFVCSTLEAALLASRIAMLTQQQARGNRGAGLLLELKRRRVDDALSAILILNTLANTLGATMAGAQAARVFGSSMVAYFSGILTLLILVISEIVPKTLGAVYARQLSGAVGWTLTVLMRAMRPALVISGMLTRLLARGKQTGVSRGEVAAVIATAASEGALSRDESTIFGNLLKVNEIQVEDVMTPRTVVFMMPAEARAGELIDAPEARVFSRVPIYSDSPENVVGYVLLSDVLRSLADGGSRDYRLSNFRREIRVLPELATVGVALRQLVDSREHLAIVTDEHGGIAGVVTLEDLTETILGFEIVDESDQIVDLRQAAARMRDRRLARLREKRQLTSEV